LARVGVSVAIGARVVLEHAIVVVVIVVVHLL